MLVTRTLYQSPTDKALSWLFVTPVIIILLIAAFIPLGWGLYLSFFRYKLNMPSATAFIGSEELPGHLQRRADDPQPSQQRASSRSSRSPWSSSSESRSR